MIIMLNSFPMFTANVVIKYEFLCFAIMKIIIKTLSWRFNSFHPGNHNKVTECNGLKTCKLFYFSSLVIAMNYYHKNPRVGGSFSIISQVVCQLSFEATNNSS